MKDSTRAKKAIEHIENVLRYYDNPKNEFQRKYAIFRLKTAQTLLKNMEMV